MLDEEKQNENKNQSNISSISRGLFNVKEELVHRRYLMMDNIFLQLFGKRNHIYSLG